MRQTPEKLKELIKLLQSKVHLKSIVMTLAVLVVFVTTYVLILPAFTLDKEEAAEQGGIDVVAVEQQAEEEDVTPSEETEAEESAEPEIKEEAVESSVDKDDKDTEAVETKSEKPEAKDGTSDVKLLTKDTELKADGEGFTISAAVGKQAEVPADTSLEVKELDENTPGFDYEKYKEDVLKALKKDDSSVEDIGMIRFYDISLESDTQEESVEPSDTVAVKIAYDEGIEVSDADNIRIVHFGEKKTEVLDVEATVNNENQMIEASFETDGFSVYAVVDGSTGENARAAVNFYGKPGTDGKPQLVATYYVKNGDILLPEDGDRDPTKQYIEDIVADPGIGGKLEEDQSFHGWYIADENTDDYTGETEPKTIEDVQKYLEGLEITEGDEVNVYAMVFKHFYISYYGDDNNVALGTHTALARLNSDTTQYTINMSYTPDANQDFRGWKTTAENGGENIAGWTEGKVYENDDTISVSGDVRFDVEAPLGNWLVYNANGKGGTYNAPQFYLTNELTAPATNAGPSDMKRNGYNFAGWYEAVTDDEGNPTRDDDGNIILQDSQFEFGHTLEKNTSIYAKWTPVENAPYTVVFWTQNIDRTAYDVAGSYVGSGRVGDTIFKANNFVNNGDEDYVRNFGSEGHYTGFSLKHNNGNPLDKDGQVASAVTITPEGDAVLNLYYDRIEYEFRFYYYRQRTGNNPYSAAQYSASYNGDGVYGVANWYGWGNTRPTQNYGQDRTASIENYTAHYFVLNAYYGEDISSRWPSYDQLGDYTSGGSTYSAVSFVMMNGTGLKIEANPPNGYGVGRGSDTIKGLITVMDEMILGKTNDADGNFVVIRYSTRNNWNYHIFYEQVEGEDYTGKTTYHFNGKDYYEDDVVESRSTNQNVDEQNAPQYRGYVHVGESNQQGQSGGDRGNNARWTTGAGNNTVYHVRYYYDRKKYNITYMDGVYFDGNNNIIQSRAAELLEEDEEQITQGAEIPDQYKNYVPDLPEGEEGYVFEGWYLDEGCTVPYTFTNMPVDGIQVHAKWRQIEYRVFLHPNAGESGSNDLSWGDEEASQKQEMNFRVSYGDKVSTPTGMITGKEFAGWYRDPEFKSVFSANAFELNETTVTAEYDKTTDFTDVMDKWGNGATTNSDITGNNGGDRFWITKKLDLYAKWRDVLVGADGINVEYVVGENGKEGTEPTDSLQYLDAAVAVAQAACSPENEEEYMFHSWVVQEWDGNEFVDTAVEVFPGQNYTIKASEARVIPDPDDPEKQIYTIRLRATYKPVVETVPTHITWYANNGTGNFITDDRVGSRHLQINEAIDVRPENTFTYPGHEFLGWARLVEETDTDGTTVIKVGGQPVAGLNIESLGEDDLWLKYDAENGKYVATGITGDGIAVGTEIRQVAADERLAYHGLVAVWERVYTVNVNKVVVGSASDKNTSFGFTPTGVEPSTAFTLKDGESKEYSGLHLNTEVSFTEAASDDFIVSVEGYYTDADGTKHDISDLENGDTINISGDTEITFTNTRKAKKVKLLKVDDSDTPVALDGVGFTLDDKSLTTNSEGYTPVIDVNVSDTPYQLSETTPKDHYTGLSSSVPVTVGVDGVTIPAGTENVSVSEPDGDGVYTITVINPRELYTVTVEKAVEGNASDKTVKFGFTSTGLNKESFQLADGEKEEFIEVPYGTAFTVVETASNDFDTSIEVTNGEASPITKTGPNTGSITVDGNVTVKYKNTRNKQVVQVYKTDESDNTPLEGAQFSLNGETLTSATDGYTGTVVLPVSSEPYSLEEVVSPDGYNLPENPSTITVNADGVIYTQGTAGQPQVASINSNNAYQINITNTSGLPLPHTGGIGTTIFYILGSLLVIGCGVVLVSRRRMDAGK